MTALTAQRHRWPPEMREKAIRLREERGWSIARIADVLGCSRGAVSWWLLIAGAEAPGKPRRPPRQQPDCTRKGFAVRRYTPEEDHLLVTLSKAGLSIAEIRRRMFAAFPERVRPHNSIVGRLATLARRDERSDAAGLAA